MSGFTLIEIILATSLSIVLLGLLGMAIQLYVHSADVGRTKVVNAALARNLLRTIADDLRRTVYASSTTAGGSGSGPGTSSGELGSEGDATPGSSSGSNSGESSDDTDDDSDAPTEDETQQAVPGLYGNQYELQMDISRVPRIDEYETLLVADAAQSSEANYGLTTVAYYAVGEMAGQSSTELSSASGASGLYRRSLNRTVFEWAMETANDQELSGGEQLLAPEVAAIEFRYFDGLEWDSQWESDVRQGLPLAVEVLLYLVDESSGDRSTATLTTASIGTTVHRLVVPLPLARPTSTTAGSTSGGRSP